MLLAIDTSTTAIGAALHDGGSVRSSVVQLDSRRHGELLAPAIVRALEEAGADRADLTRIACGVGPGPFTGLRVGVVTALVLARSLELAPPVGICSLDAIAHACVGRHEGPLLVATDARRKEVYWATYEVGPDAATRTDGPGVARAHDLPEDVRSLPSAGRGHLLYPDAIGHPLPDAPTDVDPGALADLAAALLDGRHPDATAGPGRGLLDPEPLYLRRPDAVAAAPSAAAPTATAPPGGAR